MISYYRKFQPRQALIFSDGSSYNRFEQVNAEWGIVATEDERLIREFDACIRGQRGGLEKISGEQFLEMQSKKKPISSSGPWREEWQPRKLPPTAQGQSLKQGAVAATEPAQVPRVAPPADAETAFRPKTTRS